VPAAAVIPAPIAYIKVVAVKKLVVECGVSVWVFLGLAVRGTVKRFLCGLVPLCPPCSLKSESSRGLVLRLECVFRRMSLYCGVC
jgi:hypothetical protein